MLYNLRIWDYAQNPENPVILNVTIQRQNHLESAWTTPSISISGLKMRYILKFIYIFETFDVETDPFQIKLNNIIFNCIVLKFLKYT
jgi:cytochrome b subunit of formate dehydrogenase